jgi:hypothetical protein
MEQDVKAHQGEEDAEHQPIEAVSFSTRAFPLLEMLRASRDQRTDVLWGV